MPQVCSNAHRYFAPGAFCDTILSVLRGRELGTVILTTQDPTVVPPEIISSMDLLLCHRFTSSLWLQYLQANFGLGSTQDLKHKLTCLEPSSGIAIFSSGRLVDYGNKEPNLMASKAYERVILPDNSRVAADVSPPGTSSSMTLVRHIFNFDVCSESFLVECPRDYVGTSAWSQYKSSIQLRECNSAHFPKYTFVPDCGYGNHGVDIRQSYIPNG